MQRLITDFDGPIMDVSERYYRVYQFCLEKIRDPGQEVKELPKTEFWALKRSQIPETEIGRLSGLEPSQVKDFALLRRQTVHTIPYLKYDCLQSEATPALEAAQKAGIDMVVMTMRRVRELDEAFDMANQGLPDRTDLRRFFPPQNRYCLGNDYLKTGDTNDKPLLMARAIQELPPATNTWMVGDTEADIIAAKTHGVKVIGVLCGIRNQNQLEKHQPDLIMPNLQDAVNFLLSQS
jgi:phosphoglycolate phosphatase-like HAD superfamily hydrolase